MTLLNKESKKALKLKVNVPSKILIYTDKQGHKRWKWRDTKNAIWGK